MKRKINIKSIFFEGKEFLVKHIKNDEEGIKFLADQAFLKYFKNIRFNKTYSLDILQIKTLKNEKWTLFNCYYTFRKNMCDNLYIHLVYNEIIKYHVYDRNFLCKKLEVFLEEYSNIELRLFDNNKFLNYDDFIISTQKLGKKLKVTIQFKENVPTYMLYDKFIYFMELLFFICGHFLKRKEVIYYKDGNKIYVENDIVDKYITSKKYINSDTMFFDSISDEEFKRLYENYIIVREKCCLQLDLFFISIMEGNAYTELNVVSILQVFDGIFNKLILFSDSVKSYSEDLNNQIIKKINDIDFSDLCNKYNVKINFNERITKIIASMYLCSFDKKLRKIFTINEGIIFKKELEKSEKHLHFYTLVEKCKNSRNKISHADDKVEYLKEMENVAYIYKFILTFRMLIINEIGLEKKLNISKLQIYINKLDLYIEKFID